MAIHEAMYAGLFAGQIDVIDATVDDMLPNFDPEQPYACVLTLTESLGADGIIASNDIRSIADLKGKTVAFAERTVSQFYLNVLLKEAGLSEADIEHRGDERRRCRQRLSDAGGRRRRELGAVAHAGQAGRARASPRRLPPRQPGLMVDCLVTRTDVFDDRLAEFRALARAWDAALDYVEAHPDEANGSWRATSAAGSRTRGLRGDPEGRPVLRFGDETGSTSAHRTTPARSTRPRNTASTSGRASARSTSS